MFGYNQKMGISMKKSLRNIASDEEKKKYVFKDEKDFVILDLVHQLEKEDLSSEDRELVNFIRTQLEDDWRSPIITLLKKLINKYK